MFIVIENDWVDIEALTGEWGVRCCLAQFDQGLGEAFHYLFVYAQDGV